MSKNITSLLTKGTIKPAIQSMISLTLLSFSIFLFAEEQTEILKETPVQAQINIQPSQNLAITQQLFLEKIILQGNSIFSDKELQKIVKPYLHKNISAEDLQQLRRDLTNYYINHGYINSGAIIPSQNIKNNSIGIQIIEGRLTKLHIQGLYWLRESYLQNRLNRFANGKHIFHVGTLQQKLRLLEQDPLIDRLHANIEPDTELGKAKLKLRVEEAKPWKLSLIYNNHASPNIGSKQGKIYLAHQNLTGFGDSIALTYQETKGMKAYSTKYTLPINAYDTKIWISYDSSSAKVIAEPFSLLNIESRSKSTEIGIKHPFYKTLHTNFNLSLSLRKKASELHLLGEPFSFVNSETEGRNRVTVLTFGQEWVKRSATRVLAIYSNFDFGLRALDASGPPEPDGAYQAWLGQFQLLQNLTYLKSSLLLRTNLRLAEDSLLSFEKFSLGGSNTVRGYREGEITRDNGLFSSLEWRIPLGKLPIPWISRSLDDGKIQFIPFIDYGQGWEHSGNTPEPKDISSIGFGFNWNPGSCCQIEVYLAHPLVKVNRGNVEKDLQDSGVHFNLVINF